ncbi:MAG TPA: anti-sigma factor antagonist [Candidatus Saccharimonadia bacterium]|nr:anti-sigma factor antagonist [Candidatus Saccharimonadia bacterium]
MEIAQEKRGAVFVLGPVGRLDTDSAADLELALQDLLATNATHFVVDLAQINYVSSAGLRVLLMLAKSVDKKGSLRVAGLNPQVQQVFDIAGFTKLFAMYADRDAALLDHPGVGIIEAAPAAAGEPAPRAAPKERSAQAEVAPPRGATDEAAPARAAMPTREPPPAALRESAPAPAREATPAPPREAAAAPPREAVPVSLREAVPPPPREALAPIAAREAPSSVPRESAPSLAEHVASLLGVGPAANTPLDPESKSLGRHAAMLLGVRLEGAGAASPKSATAAPKPSSAARAPALAPETDEQGGLLSRLFGKKKRSKIQ